MAAARNSHQAGRLLALLVLALSSALIAAGCGGSQDGSGEPAGGDAGSIQDGDEETTRDDGAADDAAGPPPELAEGANYEGTGEVSASGEVEMRLIDSAFDPTVLVGEPGQELTVSLKNDGAIRHTFTIEEQDIDEVLEPGATAEVKVTMPESGTTQFICRFHEAQGMVGLLMVKD